MGIYFGPLADRTIKLTAGIAVEMSIFLVEMSIFLGKGHIGQISLGARGLALGFIKELWTGMLYLCRVAAPRRGHDVVPCSGPPRAAYRVAVRHKLRSGPPDKPGSQSEPCSQSGTFATSYALFTSWYSVSQPHLIAHIKPASRLNSQLLIGQLLIGQLL